MSWLEDTALRDLDDRVLIETVCVRCGYEKIYSVTEVLLRVDHRGVYLDEVAKNLICVRPQCRHAGVRLTLIRDTDTSGFVGGMP